MKVSVPLYLMANKRCNTGDIIGYATSFKFSGNIYVPGICSEATFFSESAKCEDGIKFPIYADIVKANIYYGKLNISERTFYNTEYSLNNSIIINNDKDDGYMCVVTSGFVLLFTVDKFTKVARFNSIIAGRYVSNNSQYILIARLAINTCKVARDVINSILKHEDTGYDIIFIGSTALPNVKILRNSKGGVPDTILNVFNVFLSKEKRHELRSDRVNLMSEENLMICKMIEKETGDELCKYFTPYNVLIPLKDESD